MCQASAQRVSEGTPELSPYGRESVCQRDRERRGVLSSMLVEHSEIEGSSAGKSMKAWGALGDLKLCLITNGGPLANAREGSNIT